MRFKQALSRKLAAALSAVMILSTIAPTSVPVLAAAPDDVLVDSSVEYSLQETGSEEVLADSVESSLAEESVAPEVAADELVDIADEVVTNNVAEEAIVETTGSEPAEAVEPAEGTPAPATSGNKVLKISVWDEDDAWTSNAGYTIVWRAYSGSAVAKDFEGHEVALSANKTGTYDGLGTVSETAEIEDGTITIELSANTADRVRIYKADQNPAHNIVVLSSNELTRFDFNGKDAWDAADSKYVEVMVGTNTAPEEVKLAVIKKTEGEIGLKWVDNKGVQTSFANANIKLSYNEINGSDAVVGKRRLGTFDSTHYDYYVISGNKMGVQNVTLESDDVSYFFTGYYQYTDKLGKVQKVPYSIGDKIANPLDITSNNKIALLYNRYLLATDDSGSMSTDCIFKAQSESGKPVISINDISGAITGGSGSDYYFNDSDDNKYVVLEAEYYNADRSTRYNIKSATVNGKTCEISASPWAEGTNYFYVLIPRAAVKEAFDKDPSLKSLDVTFNTSMDPAPVEIAKPIYAPAADTAKVFLTVGGTEYTQEQTDAYWKKNDHNVNPLSTYYGRSASIIVEPKDGYKILSVNITQKVIKDGKEEKEVLNWWEEAEVSAVTSSGKSFTVGLEPVITVNAVKDQTYKVYYGTDPAEDNITETAGAFPVMYNKQVRIKMYEAGAEKGILSFNAMAGDKEIYEGQGISYVNKGDVAEAILQFNGAKLSGNKITINFGDNADIKNATKTHTIVLDVDSPASKSVSLKDSKIQKNGDKFPLGATRIYDLVINGNVTLAAEVDKAGATVTIDQKNKKLTVKTTRDTAADYKGTVKIYDANDGSKAALCSFAIETETTTVAMKNSFTAKVVGKSNNSIGISLTINKKISAFFPKDEAGNLINIDGLYYMINVKGDKAPSTTKLKQEVTEFVPATENFADISLANGELSGTDLYLGDDSVNWTVTVKLLQTKVATPSASNWDAGNNKIAASDDIVIKNVKTGAGQNFATKITLKSTGASKKLYSNMTGDKFALTINYNNGCGVQMVSKVELLNKNGVAIYTVNRGETNGSSVPTVVGPLEVNNTTIVINPRNIGVGGLDKGKYTVKAYAVEPAGYEVVGKTTVNVVEAIERMEVKPETDRLWKTSGKVASMKLDVLDQNGKATKKVKYTVVDGSSVGTADGQFTQKLAVCGAVTVKNGKITVNKTYVPTGKNANNEFKVIVEANDYAGNPCAKVLSPVIRVVNVGSVALKVENQKSKAAGDDAKNNPAGSIGASYASIEKFYYDKEKAETSTWLDIYGDGSLLVRIKDLVNSKDLGKYRYFALLNVKDNDDAGNHVVNFKYSVGGAKILKFTPEALAGNNWNGYVVIATNKPGKLTIGGTALDGSKRTLPGKKMTVNVAYNGGKLRYNLYGYDKTAAYGIVSSNAQASAFAGVNYGPADKALDLVVFGATDDQVKAYAATLESQLVEVKKIKAVNAKIKQVEPGKYSVTPTGGDVTITITPKTGAAETFTFKTPAVIKGGKAAKITASNAAFGKADAKGKIYSTLAIPAANYGTGTGKMNPNTVKYTVDFSKLAVAGTKQVMVAVVKDCTDVLYNVGDISDALGETFNAGVEKTFYVQNLTSGAFTINYSNTALAAGGNLYVKPGTYSISVTPGYTDDKGVFQATGKAVTVKVVAAKAPKANVKLATTLNFGAGGKNATAAIDLSKSKNIFNDNTGYQGISAGSDAAATHLAGINTKGTINNFAKAFEVTKTGTAGNTAYSLRFKGAAGCETINPKSQKTEMAGWMYFKWRNLDGTVDGKWIKVNLKSAGNLTNK